MLNWIRDQICIWFLGITPERFRRDQTELEKFRQLFGSEQRRRPPLAFDSDYSVGYEKHDPAF